MLVWCGCGIGVVCLLLVRARNMQKNLERFLRPVSSYDIIRSESIEGARTVMITGGNGFVGKYIAAYLAEKGVNVVVFDLSIPEESSRLKQVTYIRGNLLNPQHLEKAFSFRQVDSVIHTASLIPYLGVPEEAIWKVNVEGTKSLIDACSENRVKYFIYTSSATSVLDLSTRVSLDLQEDCPVPRKHVDAYAATKAAEHIVLDSNKRAGGLVTCVLRPAAIFGRGDKLIADRILAGKDLLYMGDGSARIDWVPVEGVARAHVLAEEALFCDAQRRQRMQGAVYFIGNNEQRQYGWFVGAPMNGDDGTSPLSHWGQPRPRRLPLWLVMALGYANLAIYILLGCTVFPPSLAPSLVDFTQRSYTFRSDRAARDFGYSPAETVLDAIKRLAAEETARRKQA